jgi:hypothetical protein
VSKEKTAIPSAKESRAIPIMVAVIGVIGTLTPVLVNYISTQSSDKPMVDIQFSRMDRGMEITLGNKGFAPATDVTLMVYAPKKIADNSSYILNTVQVDPIEISNTRLEAHIPKLVHGSGSVVKIAVYLSESPDSNTFDAYVTYEEGSHSEAYAFTTDDTDFLSQLFGRFDILTFSIIFYSIFIPLFFILLYRISRKRQGKKFISKVMENITEIRRELRKYQKHGAFS